MTSLQARQMVRDAVDDGKFKTPPEVRSNCVRVYYEKGFRRPWSPPEDKRQIAPA
jgi:hypothetical protein